MSTTAAKTFPHRRDGVRVAGVTGELALVDPADAQLHIVNATALALWELCDGMTSVDEMVDAITVLFDAPPAVIRRDVASALDQMTALGVVVWD